MQNSRVNAEHLAQFARSGFVVLRRAFDPLPLTDECRRALFEALGPDDSLHVLDQGSGTVSFQYVPVMCESTPLSLGLLDRFALDAAQLLGRAVLPGRAKATRYYGDTGWHRDSERDLGSVAFVAYLDATSANTGVFRVLPGSQRDPDRPIPDASSGDVAHLGEIIETEPGDVIIFDEHIIHGSTGGGERRQWRVDFIVDPRGPDEEELVKSNFEQVFPNGKGDPGYDARRYPSYGSYWQSLERPWSNRLRDLGVYQRAAASEGR
jgi:hypothetical protein